MLDWNKLLNPGRRKDKKPGMNSMNTGVGRKEIERDFDRILFSAPTRRLADKTQVFPLEKNDSVRTRLTHSHEVANLARSIGVRLAFDFPEKAFGKNHESLNVKRNVPPLLAAVGLAHDFGNPPFGHEGEEAIKKWFFNNRKEVFGSEDGVDFLSFDGNAQTFRLVTRLQILNDDFGLNLTYATLAALLKYPSFWSSKERGGYKKAGIFESERKIAEEVWEQTGLKQGARHPLTHIMEACDDIAYSVLDAEDTVKKGYASFYDLLDFLETNGSGDTSIDELIASAKAKNTEFKKEKLSSKELNDLSMQMLRVKAISLMVNDVTDTYISNSQKMMSDDLEEGFDLISNGKTKTLCKSLKKFDFMHGYRHKSVLELELRGSNYIHSLMDMMWLGIKNEEEPDHLFQKYVFSRLSEGYKRVYKNNNGHLPKCYKKAQLLSDSIAGMTDSYLISFHDELKPLYDGFSSKK